MGTLTHIGNGKFDLAEHFIYSGGPRIGEAGVFNKTVYSTRELAQEEVKVRAIGNTYCVRIDEIPFEGVTYFQPLYNCWD